MLHTELESANPASVPRHYASVGPWRLFRSTDKNPKSWGRTRTEKWLQRAPLGSP